MPVPAPRLPKLPELSKLQALLLAGGAFVFAVLAWGIARYDLFLDRTPSAPEGAVIAVTIDRTTPRWAAFEARLPDGPRQALALSGDLPVVTLFAIPRTGEGLDWGVTEALSAVTERTGRRRIRLVPAGTVAAGFVSLSGRTAPVRLSLQDEGFEARVGLDFLGPDFSANPFSKGRRLNAPLFGQTAYLEKPEGVSWDGAADHLGGSLQRFRGLAALWSLPGRLELAVSASETDAVNPFVLYYRPVHGGSLAGPVLESHARTLLAETDPSGYQVTLPDATVMTELRYEPDAVRLERKPVNQFGTRAQLMTPGSSGKIEIFYADDGEAWMSDDLGRIQSSIMGNIGATASMKRCGSGEPDGLAVFSGASLAGMAHFSWLKSLTVALHDVESGLFTVCGYFVH